MFDQAYLLRRAVKSELTDLSVAPGRLLPLKDKAYASLKESLCSGGFEPGAALTIQGLADALAVGVMPVRDAVQRLVAEGALILLPNRALRVPTVTARELYEIFSLRLLLEAAASRRAAVRISSDALESVEAARKELFQSHRDGDVGKALNANRRFHFAIYAAAGSTELYQHIERLWVRIGPLLVRPFRLAPIDYVGANTALHERLTCALACRRGELAEQLMRQLLRRSYKWHRSHLIERNA